MKLILVLSLGLFVASSIASVVPTLKEACVQNGNCYLTENCLCSNIDHPDSDILEIEEVPQIVFLTFDDGVTVENYPLYQKIFQGRTNPNGAPITGTFFVTHEYNNYSLTHQLYRQGHDIALHSITHKSNISYWRDLDAAGWKQEVVDQREQMSTFAQIPQDQIVGFRAPFLQGGGDTMYSVLADPDSGLKYDSSRPTWRLRPLLWPYTADFDTLQDCQIEPCPTGSYKGFWVPPLVDLLGTNEQPCAMIDTCLNTPTNKQEAYDLLMNNFKAHYTATKAPFGVYTHAAWIVHPERPFMIEGYIQFLDEILNMPDKDVFVVSIAKGIDWMKTPTAIASIDSVASWARPTPPDNECERPQTCVYDTTFGERIMNICSFPCPTNYPWIGNHLGTN
jgi:peptidoglycan/xylan/chitin deacetylase (PgdA/CDA1 family)